MIWKHSKKGNSIISLEISLDALAKKRSVLPMDSFGGLLVVSLCKIMDTVHYPLHPAPRLLEEHYELENWGQSARN